MTWQGSAFLGDGWAAFRGATSSNSAHAHPSLQITLSWDSAVTVISNACSITGHAVVIQPNIVHLIQPAVRVTLLLIEPQTALAHYFAMQAGNDAISLLHNDLASLIDKNCPLEACLDQVIRLVPKSRLPSDSRLNRALALLDRSQRSHTIAQAAYEVGLSSARLRVISKQCLGVSLSDWIIWRKLQRAGKLLAQGYDLASAAYGAGFSDQSHFARAMRSHFGITAKMISSIVK